uniref:Uncharacterized protein n=1 Tax=Salix viminalis TaxID=40686 RepID=A0A6N2ML46_SALVM
MTKTEKEEKKREEGHFLRLFCCKRHCSVPCSNGGGDGGRKRITLLDAIEKSGDRRTLETILSMEKQPGQANQTLMDIIRDEESGSLFGHRDKKSWKAFRDKLRLKRAGSAWTSFGSYPYFGYSYPGGKQVSQF